MLQATSFLYNYRYILIENKLFLSFIYLYVGNKWFTNYNILLIHHI